MAITAMRNSTYPDTADYLDHEAVASLFRTAVVSRPSAFSVLSRELSDTLAAMMRRRGHGRNTERVADIYARRWNTADIVRRKTALDGDVAPVAYEGGYFVASRRVIKRTHLLSLVRLIERLQPRRVLEVGSGPGINILILSALFPSVHFTGLELTKEGIEVAEELRQTSQLPDALRAYSPVLVREDAAAGMVHFVQGSAAAMPFAAGSFDLVFATNALEQMEAIKDVALREISRVASGHVVMFEAFREWNSSFIQRRHIAAKGFFDCSISDLAQWGLDPVFWTDRLPHKPRYAVGLVVARKRAGTHE